MPQSQDTKSRRRARTIRLVALIAILVLSTTFGLLHQTNKGGEFWFVSVDALCPFGGLESLWAVIAEGYWLKKIATSSMVLLVASLGVSLVAGRAFCGQICPLGTLQELFGRLGVRLVGKRMELPSVIDRPARFLKYGVLAFFTIWTWRAGSLVMRAYDPWAAYHHLTSPELLTEFSIGALILGVSLVGSFVYDRFFCKYLCPMGAMLAIVSRLSIFKVRRSADSCTECGLCNKACPVNIDVEAAETVTSLECLSCSECVNVCPRPGTLEIRTSRTALMSPIVLTLATVGIFFGLVAGATAAGWFDWTKPSIGAEVRRAAETGVAFDGQSIKGSMSMNDVATGTGIPASELQEVFGVTESDMSIPLKEAKEKYGFSMHDIRGYVENYVNQ